MPFRLLVYFRGRVLDDSGTPLRSRHLTAELARREDVRCLLLSADDSPQLAGALPAVEHLQLAAGKPPGPALQRAVERFRPDLVYGQTHNALGDLAALRGAPAPRRVVDLHGDLPRWRLEQHWRPLGWRLYWYLRGRLGERRYLPVMDGFTVVGETLARRLRGLRQPVEILWGGVDPERFRPPRDESPSPDPDAAVRVAYAGGFQAYHGIPLLLEAGRRLLERGERFHFTLIGGIDDHPGVRERAERLLGEHVNIAGRVPYDEIPERLRQADILVIPRAASGTARSTYPSKLSEYLALGRAIVATDVGEVGRAVRHEETALLVPPDSPEALTAALVRLRDPALRRRLGRQARAFAERRLSWSTIGDRAHAFLTRLAGATS